MYLLKKNIIFLILILILNNCTPKSPLTPRDSFLQCQKSFMNKDTKSFLKLLSRNSLIKIKNSIKIINSLNQVQKENFYKSIGLKSINKPIIDTNDYVNILFLKRNKNSLYRIFSEKIIAIKKSNNEAIIYTQNGLFIKVIKESIYWKVDISDL